MKGTVVWSNTFSSALRCLEVIIDDFSILPTLMALYWLTKVFFIYFFFLSVLFFSRALWAGWWLLLLLIDLTPFQGFSTNPVCELQQSPHHLSWWPKPQKLIYRSIIVLQEIGIDVTGSMWITSTVDNSVTQGQENHDIQEQDGQNFTMAAS